MPNDLKLCCDLSTVKTELCDVLSTQNNDYVKFYSHVLSSAVHLVYYNKDLIGKQTKLDEYTLIVNAMSVVLDVQ